MIQEIAPHNYDNEYRPRKEKRTDYAIYVQDNKIAMWKEGESYRMPTVAEFDELQLEGVGKYFYQYLFSIDEMGFFLLKNVMADLPQNMGYCSGEIFRELKPDYMAFAGITAMQMARFAKGHAYCGKCGSPMIHCEKERAYKCEACGTVDYPKISPAVIVAIRDNDKLLLTKYAYGEYKKYALVAGFVEIGESFEEAVEREVLEEVGLHIKNIRYYKSQPWSFTDTIMIGFFADLDGDCTITRQEEELAEALWMPREEIPEAERNISIGQEMIELFRNNSI
ncbi:MAG: NAD(+) diphosphatase [Lachnospiraceae bacterium]|nr:NAD(+) diphosphatase [Lachnospiraceae bacterium]